MADALDKTASHAVDRITDWANIAKFVEAFGSPWAAAIAVAIIVIVVGFIIGTLAHTLRCFIRFYYRTKVELAKIGVVPKKLSRNPKRVAK